MQKIKIIKCIGLTLYHPRNRIKTSTFWVEQLAAMNTHEPFLLVQRQLLSTNGIHNCPVAKSDKMYQQQKTHDYKLLVSQCTHLFFWSFPPPESQPWFSSGSYENTRMSPPRNIPILHKPWFIINIRKNWHKCVLGILEKENMKQKVPQCDKTRFSTIQPSIDVTGIRNERWQWRKNDDVILVAMVACTKFGVNRPKQTNVIEWKLNFYF